MFNIKTNNKNKKLLLMATLFIIGTATILFALEKNNTIDLFRSNKPAPLAKQDGPTEEELRKENESNAKTKEDIIKGEDTEDTNASPPVTDTSIDMSAQQEENGSVTVTSRLYGYSSGSCNLSIANGANTSSKMAEIIFQREYSTCAGFNIPKNELGPGTWSIKLSVESPEKNSDKATSLEVK